jgi:STE24 endopeptidase
LHHIRKIILAGIFYSAAGFWICDWSLMAWATHHGGPVDYARLPVGTLPLLLLILTLFSMLSQPLQNAVSRRFERQSDRYALERTGLKDAYLSAFCKLARLNKDDPNPHWLDVVLFHSHPPIQERLAAAGQFAESICRSGKNRSRIVVHRPPNGVLEPPGDQEKRPALATARFAPTMTTVFVPRSTPQTAWRSIT